MIEGVEKPGNLGAILRSADGAGLDAVIAADPADRPLQPERDPGQPRDDLRPIPVVIRHERRGTRLAAGAAASRIVAARVDGAEVHTCNDLRGPLAIVLGSEAGGLTGTPGRRRISRRSGLPMRGVADSLNVSGRAGAAH